MNQNPFCLTVGVKLLPPAVWPVQQKFSWKKISYTWGRVQHTYLKPTVILFKKFPWIYYSWIHWNFLLQYWQITLYDTSITSKSNILINLSTFLNIKMWETTEANISGWYFVRSIQVGEGLRFLCTKTVSRIRWNRTRTNTIFKFVQMWLSV